MGNIAGSLLVTRSTTTGCGVDVYRPTESARFNTAVCLSRFHTDATKKICQNKSEDIIDWISDPARVANVKVKFT